ncbi:MAG: hypothetical protein ABH840_00250 [Nanoarchaeota archaeon]
MEKRGQFYLAAAIIIAMVVFGLATVNNYARIESRETGIFDLRNELGLEGGSVVSFALYSGEDISDLLGNWTEVYISGKEYQEIENWLFVYGNPNIGVTVLTFTNGSAGTITIDYGTDKIEYKTKIKEKKKSEFFSDYVNITFGDFTYYFNMTSEQNFAFLINKGGYVADSSVEESNIDGLATFNNLEEEDKGKKGEK